MVRIKKDFQVSVTELLSLLDSMNGNGGKLPGIGISKTGNGAKFASVRSLCGGRSLASEKFEKSTGLEKAQK